MTTLYEVKFADYYLGPFERTRQENTSGSTYKPQKYTIGQAKIF